MEIVLEIIKNFKNNKLIIKTQQRFRSEKHYVFNDEIDKIALISNDQLNWQKHMHMEWVKM